MKFTEGVHDVLGSAGQGHLCVSKTVDMFWVSLCDRMQIIV